MGRKILRIAIALIGAAVGCGLVVLVDSLLIAMGSAGLYIVLQLWALTLIYVVSGLLFAILFYILSPKIIDGLLEALHLTEERLTTMPLMDIIIGLVGLMLGLLLALLLSPLFNKIPWPWLSVPLNILMYLLFGYLGVSTAMRRRFELRESGWFRGVHSSRTIGMARPKILDTSVIIDGRIYDICKTGIVEGKLIVPSFVLKELRHIADSADSLKRTRGRRGLDVLQTMQKELSNTIIIKERDYDDVMEVDTKLLRLAQDMNGVVVTNDYNLNKVAGVQDVPVLNINDLANAIKPVVLPGEEINMQIVREGKEAGQGIGYLDDGTMIVVDGGKKHIGETADMVVTSVLQTSAGRMIFAKLK